MNNSVVDAADSAPLIFRFSKAARRILSLSVCLGAVFGTLAVFLFSFPIPEGIAALADAALFDSTGYFRILWTYSAPCIIAVFLSAVLFGFLLLPILFLFRGFLLSYSVSALLMSGISAGKACLIIGIPALFSLFALFLLGEEAFCSSLDIYRTCRGYPRVRFSFISADRLLIAALLLSAAALARQLLIPLLL